MENKDIDPKMGCKHYQRRCQLKCEQCKEFYTCRICHDEEKYTNYKIDVERDAQKKPIVKLKDANDPKAKHKLNRFNVKEIKCLNCGTIQEPSNKCVKCGIEFAEYYCKICNFYDAWEKG